MFEWAHGLSSSHPAIQGPLELELEWRKRRSPPHYIGAVSPNHPDPVGATIDVVQVQESGGRWPGPIVINTGFIHDVPGLEIIAEGISSVSLGSVAVGCQGRFLFWGFTKAPAEMTELGRRLFVNCVHHLWRKRHGLTVPFRCPTRRKITGYFEQAGRVERRRTVFLRAIPRLLTARHKSGWKTTMESTAKWIEENIDYLHPVRLDRKTGFLDIDADAKALGTPNHRIGSLERWIELAAAGAEPDRSRARRCLDRYIPEAIRPVAGEWRSWFGKMKDRLVFVDTAGFVFLENPVILEKEAARRRAGGTR